MMLIDTHCHLDFPEFDQDADDTVARAKTAGVAYIINIGSSAEGTRRSVELAARFPEVYATVGIHPHYAKEVKGRVPDELRSLSGNKKVVAVGEVGLDYYRNLSPREMQKDLFKDFLGLAKEKDLPIVIHSRNAHEDTMKILRAHASRLGSKIKGVMHCFSADEECLKECLELGLYISFTCNLTFKNAAKLRALAAKVPVERLLLETDAPFLAPQEFRGRRNEPSYLRHLVKEHARIHGLSEEDIARITTHNAKMLFGLPLEEAEKIAYPIRGSLYLNITNRCTNACDFCIKNSTDFVKGHNLKLTKEPSAGEIIKAAGDVSGYREVVFCGYGEPTIRLDVIKEVSNHLKTSGVKVRLVTNGEGDLIHKRPIVKELKGLIDRVSVSLNVDTEEKYDRVCKSIYGRGTFDKIKEFAAGCKTAGIDVELTFLDLPDTNMARCEKIAKEALNVKFRLRRTGVVG